MQSELIGSKFVRVSENDPPMTSSSGPSPLINHGSQVFYVLIHITYKFQLNFNFDFDSSLTSIGFNPGLINAVETDDPFFWVYIANISTSSTLPPPPPPSTRWPLSKPNMQVKCEQ